MSGRRSQRIMEAQGACAVVMSPPVTAFRSRATCRDASGVR